MIGKQRIGRAVESTRARAVETVERVKAQRGAEALIPHRHENFRYQHFIMAAYLDYVARVSWADHAVSLPTAAVLAQLCDQHQPGRILDTGSGFSSYVLRRYASSYGGHVVSVDDDPEWMAKTIGYLRDEGVDTSGEIMTWAEFKSAPRGSFDLIFHDMGTHAFRAATALEVTQLGPDALVIYDDTNVPAVRAATLAACEATGKTYYSMRDVTVDRIGRYAGIGDRTG